jgi:hypothetical protein
MTTYTSTRNLFNPVIVAAVLLATVLATPASAQTWSSSIQGQAPPPNVAYGTAGAWESDTSILGFFEGGCMQLEDDLVVDIDAPDPTGNPFYGGSSGPFQQGLIPAGEWVRSHFLHSDLESLPEANLNGWVELEEDILGVIIQDETLDLSVMMEVPGTSYPLGTNNRGMESNDSITLSLDMRRLDINRWHLTRPGDQIRFVTSCDCPPPEPESVDGDLHGYNHGTPAPASVMLTSDPQIPGAWESNTEIQAFYESCVELTKDLDVDGGTIPAGTNVRCRLLHFDSIEGAHISLEGTVYLSEELLGVITEDDDLDDSDFCGAPGTTYPTNLDHRGLEGADIVQADFVLDQVSVDLEVTWPGDQVRIVTECQCPSELDPVPDPNREGEGEGEGEGEIEEDCGDEDEGEIAGEDFVDTRPEGCSCNREGTVLSGLTLSMLGLFPLGLARRGRGRRRESR